MSSEQQRTRLPTATVQKSDEGQSNKPYRRRFSNYLLNKQLQLRYIGFVTVISALLIGTLGYMIYQQKSLASSQIVESLDSLCEEPGSAECNDLEAAIGQDLSSRDTKWVLRLAGVGVGLVMVLVLYLLIMTHKVAGPLYKVSLYFDKMAQGRLGETYPIRKGDMLKDFYDKFQDMHQTVRARHREENEVLGRFLTACDDAGVKREGSLGAKLDDLAEYHKNRTDALS